MLTRHEIDVLTQVIDREEWAEVIDEDPDQSSGLMVLDGRYGLCVVVEHPDQFADLIEHGAEWYLNSQHNFTSKR